MKELYTKPSILQWKKTLNPGQVRIATKVRLEMFGLSRKKVGDYQLESAHLMEVMVGHNSYCCGEVQASDVSPDGDGVTGICMSYVG